MFNGQAELLPSIDDSIPSRMDKRRAKNGLRKTNDLKELRALHHQILRLTLYGLKPKAIAERLGCSDACVRLTINSTLGREKLAIMTGAADAEAVDFDKEIQSMIKPALNVYKDILNGQAASLQLKKATADTIIKDIAGRVAPKEINARHLHAHITREEIEDLKQRGYEAAAIAGILVTEDE